METGTSKGWQLVNLYGDPLSDHPIYDDKEKAEDACIVEWNKGWEVYVAPVKDKA